MDELNRSRVSKEVLSSLDRRRPPAHLRSKLNYFFRFHKRTVELIEVRPRFKDPTKKSEHAFAKATFIKKYGLWKVYWMRGNLKWHPYEPHTVKTLNLNDALFGQIS